MNQLCKVCGEPAAGFHFGAFTCEGCKSFFGRTYNNLGSISECKNNGECVINKKNRTACKACRLRKCLLVGMSKSGSRYGRRSNWFKIHCLLQEQQQHQVGGGGVGGGGGGGGGGGVSGLNSHSSVTPSNLLRPHPYLPFFHPHRHHHHHHHHLQLPGMGMAATMRDNRSSESDSGASSADPDDDLRSTSSALSFLKLPPASPSSERDLPTTKTSSPAARITLLPTSVATLPSSSPGPPVSLPRWLPPLQGVADPTSWRDLWLKGALSIPMATAAPDQDQPIDLSVRQTQSPPPSSLAHLHPPAVGGARSVSLAHASDDNVAFRIATAPDESAKSTPLDLTREGNMQITANL